MSTSTRPGLEPSLQWSGATGEAWLELHPLLEAMFEPIDTRLLEALRPEVHTSIPPLRVLDIGCGTGGTTLALARAFAGRVECVGIDVSVPMLTKARQRAELSDARAEFICANAQTHAFEPGRFDLLMSRFGVMFFSDSAAAFDSLRRAAKPGALLCTVVWRGPEENAFMTTAERAAAPLLPELPPRRADEPGQFGLADAARLRGILEGSGWSGINIQGIDVSCALSPQDLPRYLSRLGPVAQALAQLTPDRHDQVLEHVVGAFEPFRHGAELRFDAACWLVRARA